MIDYKQQKTNRVILSKRHGFPGGAVVKNPPADAETQVQSLGREDPLEEEMATHSHLLAWEIPRTGKPEELQTMGSQRVRSDFVTECTHTQAKDSLVVF